MIFSDFLNLKIKDLMQKSVVTMTADFAVDDAVKTMVSYEIGSVVILDDKKNAVLGILTERDLMTRVMATHLDSKTTLIRNVMTKVPVALSPDLPVAQIFSLLKEKNIRHVPIVDRGKLVGIISIKDVFKMLHKIIGDVIFGAGE